MKIRTTITFVHEEDVAIEDLREEFDDSDKEMSEDDLLEALELSINDSPHESKAIETSNYTVSVERIA